MDAAGTSGPRWVFFAELYSGLFSLQDRRSAGGSDCCQHVSHVHKLLKQAIQDAGKEKKTNKPDTGVFQVTWKQMWQEFCGVGVPGGESVRKPKSVLASLLRDKRVTEL